MRRPRDRKYPDEPTWFIVAVIAAPLLASVLLVGGVLDGGAPLGVGVGGALAAIGAHHRAVTSLPRASVRRSRSCPPRPPRT